MQPEVSLPSSAPPAGTTRPVQSAAETGLHEQLRLARQRGKYMVAVYSVEKHDDGRPNTLHLFRFTSAEFPKGDFNECVRLLQENLVAEASKK